MKQNISLDPQVLGQILLLQSSLYASPDDTRLGEQVCYTLTTVPGIHSVAFYLNEKLIADRTCNIKVAYRWPLSLKEFNNLSKIDSPDELSLQLIPLQTGKMKHGNLVLAISNIEIGSKYIPFIENTANQIALLVENRKQEAELKQLNNTLEKQVIDRTEALVESEQLFRSTFESTAIGMCLTTPDGYLNKVNPALCKMLGYPEEELVSKKFGDFTHPDDIALSFNKIKLLIDGNVQETLFEKRYVNSSGKTVWASVGAYLVRNDRREPLYFVTHIEDITEKKQVQETLIQSEEKFRTTFDSSSDAIFIHDMEGHFLEVNKVACKRLGYSRDEILQMTPLEIDTPESARLVPERIRTLEINGRLVFEGSHKRKDGTSFPVEVNSKLIEFDGKQCIISVARDISDRKRIEEKLKEREQRYRNLFNQANEGLLVLSLDGQIIDVNQAFADMHGYSLDDLKGLNIGDIDVLEQGTFAERSDIINRILSGEVVRFEVEHYHKEGHIIFLNVTTSLIHLGKKSYFLAFHQDITEQKRTAERLQQAQKMESIGSLAGGIAHDFNNILFPIVGMSELLLEDLPDDSLEYENAQEILKAGRRGAELVQQILAFSRQSEHKIIPVRIQQILKEVLKLTRATIPSNIEMIHQIQPDCGLVMADPTQIHQVAMNIVTNASHAVESKDGKIFILLQEIIVGDKQGVPELQPGKYAQFSVADNGHGIPKGLMDKIFEPYFTTKEQGKGTGLGLSVVYGIIKEHKGEIILESEVKKGTTFNIYLPIMEKEAVIEQNDLYKEQQTGKENILLVDDEESIGRLESQMLSRLGYNVTLYNSSIKALEALKNNPEGFDLIITDMTMPNMTGDQLAKELLSTNPDLPIIICTGFSERINKEQAKKIGVKGFLLKPVTKSDMARMVRNVLDDAKNT